MNPTDIANALLFGIPLVTYAGLQHGLESLKTYTTCRSREDEMPRAFAAGAEPKSPPLRVAVATSRQQIEAAQALVRRRYAWRGYDCDADAQLKLSRQRYP